MLPEGYQIRPLEIEDAAELAAAYRRNRDHLAATEPARAESFYTEEGQREAIGRTLADRERGATFAWVLVTDAGRIVGRLMLSNIVRGPLQSGNVGYWVDHEHLGRGLGTALAEHAAAEGLRLGLHRLEAGTLLDNHASQGVLRASGFTRYGVVERFLFIRGEWRDHILFQRILHDDPPGA